MIDDTFCGMAVPQLGHATAFASCLNHITDQRKNEIPIAADDDVGALLYSDRAFGAITHCQARNAERSSLLLNPTRIREDQRCAR